MIKLSNIGKIYNKGKSNECIALTNVNIEIADGELTAVVGRSGSGKSTLLHILGCIDNSTSGKYYLGDDLVSGLSGNQMADVRNKKIGIVMQDFALVEEYSSIENVMIPLAFSKHPKKQRKETAMNALKAVDINDLANKNVKELSGGQKQRVAIARAIVNNPSVILADEPTGALDSKTAADIMDLFKKLNNDGKTVIIVTHDKEIAAQCGRIIEISDGRIV
ncbi:MAG: ABC transporter ATP-binding protein [Oscillospiraceae bacterium]|nr:ABC transporter ATP-binding protein [Oscillospiraceae bacterium]